MIIKKLIVLRDDSNQKVWKHAFIIRMKYN